MPHNLFFRPLTRAAEESLIDEFICQEKLCVNHSDVRRTKQHHHEQDGGINRMINNCDIEQSRISSDLSEFSEETPLKLNSQQVLATMNGQNEDED